MGNWTRKLKTEHGGAKNGGGYWGPRVDAKRYSRKARRRADKVDPAALCPICVNERRPDPGVLDTDGVCEYDHQEEPHDD